MQTLIGAEGRVEAEEEDGNTDQLPGIELWVWQRVLVGHGQGQF